MSSLFKAAPKKRGRPPKIAVNVSPAKKEESSASSFSISKRSVRPVAEKIEKVPKNKQTQAYLDLTQSEKEIVDMLNEPIPKGTDFDTAVKNKYDKLVKWHGTTDVNSIESSMKGFFNFLVNQSVVAKMYQYLSFDVIDKVDNQFVKQQLDAPLKFGLAAETDARYIKLLNYAKIKTVADYNEKSNVIGFLIGYMSQHPELEEQLRMVESKMDDYVDEYKEKESIMNVFEKVKKERRSERNQVKKAAKKQM
jgi:predicted secreted protein